MKTMAVALAGFREARRNRVTVVVAAFALVVLLMTTLVLNLTIFTLDRVVIDFGLGVMSLMLVALAIFLSVGVLSREIEKRTVFLVVSREMRRGEFVVGKLLATMSTLTMVQGAMALVFGAHLLLLKVEVTGAVGWAMVGLWFELLLLSSIGICFSSFAGQVTAAVCVVGLYLLGHAAPDLYRLGETVHDATVGVLGRTLYYAVPNLDRLDFRWAAAHETPVDVGEALRALASSAAWASVFMVLAVAVFSRRDFK